MTSESAQQCRKDLIEIFSHQTTKLLSLNAYLLDIKERIAANDVDALNSVLQQDISPVEALEELELQRQNLLSVYGFDYGKDELEKCIAWCDRENQAELGYQQLSDALSQLKHSIQINDLLVSKGKKRIRRALQLLTGQNNLQNTVTYTDSGETQESAEHRSIARA